MKIQYMSDLHVEFYDELLLFESFDVDILIIAGNIGNPYSIKCWEIWCKTNYTKCI